MPRGRPIARLWRCPYPIPARARRGGQRGPSCGQSAEAEWARVCGAPRARPGRAVCPGAGGVARAICPLAWVPGVGGQCGCEAGSCSGM
jgi:hypothetical protein